MSDLTDDEIDALLPEGDGTGEVETPVIVRGVKGFKVQVIEAWTKPQVYEIVRAAIIKSRTKL